MNTTNDLIVRRVKVDRSRTPQKVLSDTGRIQGVMWKEVLSTMPHGSGEEVDVYFFKLGLDVNYSDLDKEFELRGLIQVDPYSLSAVNQDDPAFADEKPNCTYWKGANSEWCFETFSRGSDGREVVVSRSDLDWDDRWWFAGLRK